MLSTGGDGSAAIKYNTTTRQWEIVTGNTNRVVVSDTVTTVSNDLTVSGDLSSTGGAAQSFTFVNSRTLQGAFAEMTASVAVVTSSDATHQSFTRVPMVRSGSILGFVIHTQDGLVKSGSLSASVMIDGVNTALTIGMNTGSVAGATAAKDTYTFNSLQTIGISLSASSTYLGTPGVTSASFIATVLVEL